MKDNPKLTLPERIRYARKHAGMSMEGLRIASGAGKGMGQKWELAENDPSYRKPNSESIQTIAGVCGVRLEWLEKGTGDMEDRNRSDWGQRIAEAIRMMGGLSRMKDTPNVSTETIRRWMRVGPATIGEAVALEEVLVSIGLPKAAIATAMKAKSDDFRLTKFIKAERADPPSSRTPHIRRVHEWMSIPLYDVKAAAGSGYENGDQAKVISDVKLTDTFIRTVLRTQPDFLVALHIEGDSMAPSFTPGDILLVDAKTHQEIADGIFLFRQDESLLVKQLQRLPGGNIQVSSRNPEYPSYTINQDNAEGFQIIGRVVGKCGRI